MALLRSSVSVLCGLFFFCMSADGGAWFTEANRRCRAHSGVGLVAWRALDSSSPRQIPKPSVNLVCLFVILNRFLYFRSVGVSCHLFRLCMWFVYL